MNGGVTMGRRRIRQLFSGGGLALPPPWTALVAGAALLTAILAGVDYIITPPGDPSLSFLESAVPLDVWGWYLIVSAGAAATGWALSRWRVTILGHAALAGIYAAFGAAALIVVVEAPEDYGWRFGVTRLCLSVIHVALVAAAWRMWDTVRDQARG